jgi:hypothetical protein
MLSQPVLIARANSQRSRQKDTRLVRMPEQSMPKRCRMITQPAASSARRGCRLAASAPARRGCHPAASFGSTLRGCHPAANFGSTLRGCHPAASVARLLDGLVAKRGCPTRPHSELGRETPPRPWYCVTTRGRVGRCQAIQQPCRPPATTNIPTRTPIPPPYPNGTA